jgi:hypothetical protein
MKNILLNIIHYFTSYKYKVVEKRSICQFSNHVVKIYFYFRKKIGTPWEMYKTQTLSEFNCECFRFNQVCGGDWKKYINLEIDTNIYYVDRL